MSESPPSIQERILEAARQLFLEKGYNGSNLRHIAKAAQVSMGGIYHHFSSKEEIYQVLIKDVSVATEMQKLIHEFQSDEFPRNLGRIGAAIFSLARQHQDYFKLVYIDVLEFQGRNVAHVIKGFRDTVRQLSGQLLAKRDEAGELGDVHPAVIMRCMIDVFLFHYLEEIMLEKSLSEDLGMSDEQLAEEMARLMLYGTLRSPAPPRKPMISDASETNDSD